MFVHSAQTQKFKLQSKQGANSSSAGRGWCNRAVGESYNLEFTPFGYLWIWLDMIGAISLCLCTVHKHRSLDYNQSKGQTAALQGGAGATEQKEKATFWSSTHLDIYGYDWIWLDIYGYERISLWYLFGNLDIFLVIYPKKISKTDIQRYPNISINIQTQYP